MASNSKVGRSSKENRVVSEGSNAKNRKETRNINKDKADIQGLTGTSFEDFGLDRQLLLGLHEKNFHVPTPVQESCIPLILNGKSVLARSKNGTGKTAAYLIPILNMIDTTRNELQSVILVPTRELALQVSQVCKELCKYLEIKVMAILGGTDWKKDVARMNTGVHLIVSTPAKMLHVLQKTSLSAQTLFCIVLDEADKIISEECNAVGSTPLKFILENVPNSCSRVLISATYPVSVVHFIKKYARSVVEVNHMKELTLKNITQFYAYLEEKQKIQCLWTLFKKLRINQSIIFCNSLTRVKLLNETLQKLGIACNFIHSRLEQKDRTQIFHDFRIGVCRHLISSDLFCRGIDVSSVNLVVNFDFPSKSAVYLHRIGRSGRYGRKGIAVSFITRNSLESLKTVCEELKTQISPVPEVIDENLYIDDPEKDCSFSDEEG